MSIITISRGTMSGGRAVADCLADYLGYPCVGREVLQEAAASLGASEDVVRAKLQTPPGPWDLVTKERNTYVLAVQTALATQCVAGDLVYHGLAGQFLLRGLPGVVRVRLIAPTALRVQALISSHVHTTHEAAERYIRAVDRQRRRWVRALYGEDVGDPSLYDLTINLQSLTLDTTCVMIAELVQRPEHAVTPAVRDQLETFAASCRRQLDEVVGERK